MQIIVPMSGFGERFKRAGYRVPKPLIVVEGKPIIAHVIDMFPGEAEFVFICNREHLDNPEYRMAETLREYCPTGRVVAIEPHKLGPVHAVRQVAHLIHKDEPVVVNYCDFTCYWDWQHFKRFVGASGCDGAIPAYKGFHPHTLGTTNYAYMQEANGWVQDIQEKQPYTDNRMEEFASSGTYYYRTGALMLAAFEATIANDLKVGGEFYVSLTYKPMLAEGRAVAVYPLQHFMQWGTPEDVAEYEGWSKAFRQLCSGSRRPSMEPAHGSVVMPMAGLGQRFTREGYVQPKPLIEVSGRPMVVQATSDLPAARRYAFVLRGDMPGCDAISQTLRQQFPGALVHVVPEVTAGQACSADLGVQALLRRDGDVEGPITFGACDSGALYDAEALSSMLSDETVDVIAWVVRGHANSIRHPEMFGWVAADEEGRIERVSVKVPLGAPSRDPVITGTFTFRRAADFQRALARMVECDDRVKGEFYLDSCINHALALGMRCRIFEVDHLLCWGTPDELKTFQYWQSCFDKWATHPYRLEADGRVPADAVARLREVQTIMVPGLPWERP